VKLSAITAAESGDQAGSCGLLSSRRSCAKRLTRQAGCCPSRPWTERGCWTARSARRSLFSISEAQVEVSVTGLTVAAGAAVARKPVSAPAASSAPAPPKRTRARTSTSSTRKRRGGGVRRGGVREALIARLRQPGHRADDRSARRQAGSCGGQEHIEQPASAASPPRPVRRSGAGRPRDLQARLGRRRAPRTAGRWMPLVVPDWSNRLRTELT
jgi:hypothetical protein